MSTQSFIKCAEKSAFVIGFTGETGKEVVKELLEKNIFKKIVLIGRRTVKFDDPIYEKTEQKVVDFDQLENHKDAFSNCEYGFSCLGTTTRASGKDGFVKIDHDYVVQSAKIAHEMGCQRFAVISAQNANKNSMFFYPKIKGLMEEHVTEMPFEKVTIGRPSFILSTTRPFSMPLRIVMVLLKPIIWAKPTFISVPVEALAKAVIYSVCSDPIDQRVDILDNATLHAVAEKYDKVFFK